MEKVEGKDCEEEGGRDKEEVDGNVGRRGWKS